MKNKDRSNARCGLFYKDNIYPKQWGRYEMKSSSVGEDICFRLLKT